MKKIKNYYGLPGTGKTTALLKEVDGFIAAGYGLEDICFCTYRRKMANEIYHRIKNERGLSNDESKEALRYFTTIHGVCRRILNPDIKVVDKNEIKKFCENYGYNLSESDDGMKQTGNVFFTIKTWLAAHNKTPKDFNEYPGVFETSIHKERFIKMYSNWDKWKSEGDMIDYDDMLLDVIEEKASPPIKILIVDEFQDMNPLQFRVYEIWRDSAEQTIIAGDPNQSIYGFMGASPYFFINEGEEKIILRHTHRLNEVTWNFARSIIERNEPIPDITTNNRGGEVKEVFDILSHIDLNKKTYIIYRCNYIGEVVKDTLDKSGIPYLGSRFGWTEREINIYNCIFKLRLGEQEINKDELISFLNILKSNYVKNIKKTRMDEILPSTMTTKKARIYLNPFFIEDIIHSSFNSEFTIKSGLSSKQEKKIDVSLRKYKKIISNVGNIFIGTIHSVKGGECEDTFLLGNVTNRILRNMRNNPEDYKEENRVFFVGSTRHTNRLFIIKDYLHTGTTFNFPSIERIKHSVNVGEVINK